MAEFDKAKCKGVERETYSRKARSYAKYGSAIFEALSSPLLEIAQLQPSQKVLDVACGIGIPSLAAAESVEPGGSVVGIDLAPGTVDLASVRACVEVCFNYGSLPEFSQVLGTTNRMIFPNITAPSGFAMMATRYFSMYGLSIDEPPSSVVS